MADIKKTLSELLNDYADNNVGNITPQLLRNGFKTAIGSMAVSAINTNYSIVEDDIFINVTPTVSDVNIIIPSAELYNEKYFIVKNSGITYNVILSGSIDNNVNYSLLPGNTIAIAANGTTWLSYIKPFELSNNAIDYTLSGSGTISSPLGVTLSLSAGIQNVNATSASEGNILAFNNSGWVARGNFYNWDDTAQIVYDNQELWNSAFTSVSANSAISLASVGIISATSAAWNNSNSIVSANSASWNSKVGSYSTPQSAYLVSAIAVVSAMPEPESRIPNVLYFLLS